jgi:hypothetical protein
MRKTNFLQITILALQPQPVHTGGPRAVVTSVRLHSTRISVTQYLLLLPVYASEIVLHGTTLTMANSVAWRCHLLRDDWLHGKCAAKSYASTMTVKPSA